MKDRCDSHPCTHEIPGVAGPILGTPELQTQTATWDPEWDMEFLLWEYAALETFSN